MQTNVGSVKVKVQSSAFINSCSAINDTWILYITISLFVYIHVDEVDETALVVLPFPLPQKKNKIEHKEFIRFFSVCL